MMPQDNQQINFTPEQGQQAEQQIRALLQEQNFNTTLLAEIGQWAERVIMNPKEFPAFQEWLRSRGLEESEIPDRPDYQELTNMVAMGKVAGDMDSEQQTAPRSAGPISPDQMAEMAAMGRGGDTMLAHITPDEAALLESQGGAGTINPATGLPEYNIFSDIWKGIRRVAKEVAPFVLPVVAVAFPALLPAIGTTLGASAALAPVVGAAAVSGATTLLAGGSVKDALKGAALTGLGAYLTPIVGNYVGGAVGITNPAITSAIGSATLAGGMAAARGASVSQILAAAATGAASNALGQIAANAIGSGGITNAKITQKTFDDAVFAAHDAANLKASGLGENQIRQVLESSGIQTQAAQSAAAAAAAGKSADAIAVELSNKFGSMKNLYTNGKTGVENSVAGGQNVKALELVQRSEDARFAAEDAIQLKNQGLSQAQIAQNLRAAGVDAKIADFAASNAFTGKSVDAIVSGVNDYYKNTPVFSNAVDSGTTTRTLGGEPVAEQTQQQTQPTGPARIADTITQTQPVAPEISADVEFAAADAAQLRAQGIGRDQIQDTLVRSGVSQQAAYQAALYASRGMDANTIATNLARSFGTQDIYTPQIQQTPRPVDPYEVDQQTTRNDTTVTLGGAVVPDPYEVDQQTTRDETTALIGQGSDGRDPYEVDQQTTRDETTALIGQGSDGQDPYEVDQTTTRDETTALIGQGSDGQDPYEVDQTTTRDETTALDTSTTGGDSSVDTGAITGTTGLTNTPGSTTPPRRDLGTFTPAAPDPSWSIPLQYPGVNPGFVGLAVQPAYQTTSPVQSQYYWGRQPYFAYREDLQNYNQVPMPAQPWGLQQGYFEQPLALPQIPVYGENMFVQPQPIAPVAPQMLPVEYSQARMMNQLPFPPTAQSPLASIQGVVPSYQVPAAPNYVYNIAPTVDQYSIPTAAPVA